MGTIEDTIREHVEAFNAHDPTAWASHYAADVVVEDPYYAEPLKGREAAQKDIADFFRAFPDAKMEVNNILARDHSWAVEFTMRATHKGPLELPAGTFEATNRRVEFKGSVLGGSDDDGKLTEEHRYFDVATQMAQLGLSP
jgi:steroid delta-isomerase-like uncharacterized protein